MAVENIRNALLDWYDANARSLPWRLPPGSEKRPDPYGVWLSEVMLQQTTVAAVTGYYQRFIARWPTVRALAAADDGALMSAWAGLGYYARARNLIACARAVAGEHGGRFPDAEAALRTLPGIGAYTAAAIAAIAFDRPATVVDGNVERVVARLFAIPDPLPDAKPLIRQHAETLTPEQRPGDFAQAMMDLGATLCTPRAPACGRCPVSRWCRAFAEGDPARLPVKRPKQLRPQRQGIAYWLEAEGKVLLVRRPAKGLLGGMMALPSGPWTTEEPGLDAAPLRTDWKIADEAVSHVFTHFALTLKVAMARAPARPEVSGIWHPISELNHAGLPTVFAKAARLGLASRQKIMGGV